MRIALISQEYPPARHGGLGTQTFQKAHGLAARGHEVHVICHSVDGRRGAEDQGSVRVTRIPGFDEVLDIRTEAVRWLTHSVRVAAAIEELQAREPLDLVDLPEWGGEGYIHLLNRTPWKSIPTVVQLHGPLVMFAHTMGWPDRDSEFYRVGTMMEATCLRLADAVYSSSQCSIDWCAKHYGLDSRNVAVLHTGVDVEHFRPLPIPNEDRPTIVFVGKLVANKGVESLTAAAIRLRVEFPGLRLRLLGAGEPQLVQRVQEMAAAAGSSDWLELPGFVSRDQLPRELSRAHVFAAPSVYEGGPGFVYLEAMACGLPVIACAGSGASECVRHGTTGLLVPPHDTAALTDALRRLLADEGMRREMSRDARQYVVEHASSGPCLQRLEAFYAQVVERRLA